MPSFRAILRRPSRVEVKACLWVSSTAQAASAADIEPAMDAAEAEREGRSAIVAPGPSTTQ